MSNYPHPAVYQFVPVFACNSTPSEQLLAGIVEHYKNGEFIWRCCNCRSEWSRKKSECNVCYHMRCDACEKFEADS